MVDEVSRFSEPDKFDKINDPSDLEHINTQDLITFYDAEQAINFTDSEIEALVTCSDPEKSQVYLIQHLTKHPVLDEMDTEIEFNVGLPSENSGKNSWMYSTLLQKVFIKMCKTFTVDISYKPLVCGNICLYLRAMIVYSASEDLHLPVNRCHNHENSAENNLQINQNVLPHILRCKRSDTIYCGVRNGENFCDRLAILIPLGSSQQPIVSENINFEFVCQNSCGMNRKATAVIFTLENSNFEILGKRLMNFKVCSCPKRDKDKEEASIKQNLPPKNKTGGFDLPHGKKIKKEKVSVPPTPPPPPTSMQTPILKKEPDSSEETSDCFSGTSEGFRIVLDLPDEQTALHVLKDAFNAVAGKMASDRTRSKRCVPYIKRIKKQIDKINKQ